VKVAIRRVGLASLGKFGCLLGVVAAFVPSLLCGLAGVGLANVLRRWLEGWEKVTITLLGRALPSIDLVQMLGLEQVMEVLRILGTASVPVLVMAVLAMALISGAVLAMIIALVGLVYNLLAAATGGLVLEMRPIRDKQTPE
jgi:hypothetical protein